MRKSKWLIEREFNAAVDDWKRSLASMTKVMAEAAFTINQQSDLLEQVIVEKRALMEELANMKARS